MKLELRSFGPPALVLLVENKEEAALIDAVMGAKVELDGLIANVEGQVRLSDGHADHYILLQKKGL